MARGSDSGWNRLSTRRRVALAFVVLALAGATGVVLGSGDEGGFDREGSIPLEGEPAIFEIEDPPASYRIDYLVEGFGGDEDVVVSADRLWVRRPFESRLEVYDDAAIDGEPGTVQVGAFGVLGASGERAAEVVVAAPPGPPASDVRIGAALRDALDDGRLELRERREVAGRTCQVVRTAALFASSDLLLPPTGEEYADTCVDAAGLVLEELLVEEGEPLLRRVATDVEVDPGLDDVSFEVGDQTVPPDQGGGFVAETEPDSRQPGTFFESTTPVDFVRRGRYAVVPPQIDVFADVTRRNERLTYLSDVFVDGPDVVVLDQGGTLGGVDPFPDLQGVEVDLGDLGEGVLSYGVGGPVVVVPRDGGKFLRARGTVRPTRLLDLLRSLEEVEGGELELLDE